MLHWSFVASSLLAQAVVPAGGREAVVSVVVTALRNDAGRVGVALFASADGFPEDYGRALRQDWCRIEATACRITFEGVPFGRLAVAVFHDENENGRLDKNFLGIPREGYAASNGARGRFGPPKFEAAALVVDSEAVTVTIAVGY